MRLASFGILCAAGALLPSSAGAATARVTGGYSADGYTPQVLHYELGPAERSGVVVTGGPFGVTLRDPGRTIQPGAGCEPLAPDAVACGRAPQNCTIESRECPILSSVEIRLTAESDVVDASGTDRVDVHVSGGGGDDRVTGGSGNDVFSDGDAVAGRTGRDVFDGADGTDLALYRDRRKAVRIDLSRDAEQGERGEADALLRVESATGGHGDDVISGSAAGGRLSGGPGGDDAVRGGAGSDRMLSTGGRDILSGGGGDDELMLTSRRGRARLECGTGDDTVTNVRLADLLEACERVRFRTGFAHVGLGEALRITNTFCTRCGTVSVRYGNRALVQRPLRRRGTSGSRQVVRVAAGDRSRVRCGSGIVRVRFASGRRVEGFRWRPPWGRCR